MGESMTKGISKHWTPQAEEHFERLLGKCHTFAHRFMITSMRNLLKYDWRSKAGKRAYAKLRLQLVVATDRELEELAKLQVATEQNNDPEAVPRRLAELKKRQAEIRKKGIKKSELECR